MSTRKPRTLDELAEYNWPPTVSFAHRLTALCRAIQTQIDKLPSRDPIYLPRVRSTTKISLDDLALILPPREKQILDHLRAKKSPATLLGQRGFKDISTIRRTTQKVVSRVHRLCGSRVRHQLLQYYDRPGHDHRRRRGHPRVLLPRERIPELEVYLPVWMAAHPPHGLKVLDPLPKTSDTHTFMQHAA